MKKLVKVNCIVLCLIMLFQSSSVFAKLQESEIIYSVADTYINEADKTANYAYSDELYVSASSQNVMKSFIVFYVKHPPQKQYRVILRIKPKKIVYGEKEGTVSLYGMKTHDWKQGRINWYSAPETASKLKDLTLNEGEICEVDVTDYFQSNLDSRGYVSFALTENKDTGSCFCFESSDRGNVGAPQLYIEKNCNPSPEPTNAVSSDTVLEEEAAPETVKIPDNGIINENTDIESYTTTRYSPWLVNYHLTLPEQVKYGRKGGEAGQMMWSMALSQDNPDKILIGSDCEGIYLSEDGGETFRSSAEGLKTFGTSDMAFYPGNDNIAFVMAALDVAGQTTKVNENVGIYKSTDGGKTWKQKLVTSFHRTQSLKLIQFGKPDKNGIRPIYVASHGDGIWKSYDLGETWENIGLKNNLIRNLEMKDNIIVAATTDSGIICSDDYGKTWIQRNDGLDTAEIFGIAVNPLDYENWFCCTKYNIYESKNSGIRWEKINDNVSIKAKSLGGLMFGPPDENKHARIYLLANECQYTMRYSDDGGKTFELPIVDHSRSFMKYNYGYWNEPFAVNPEYPNLMWVSLDGELYRSFDGGTNLQACCGGYSGVRGMNYLFNADNPSDIIISSIDRGVIRSVPVNDEWYPMMYYAPMESQSITGGKTSYGLARDPKNPDRILALMGGWTGGYTMYESLDNGINYVPNTEMQNMFKNCIMFNPQNQNVIYSGRWKSTDNGKTWNEMPMEIFTMSPSNGEILYANYKNNVYISENGGQSFRKFTNSAISGLQAITVDRENPYKIYVGLFQDGFVIVENGIVKRITEKNGLKASRGGKICIYSIAQDPANPKHLAAGGADNSKYSPMPGLFESYDGGESWNTIEMPSPCDIWRVFFHPTRPQIFIGTSGGTYVYEFENYRERPESYFTDISGKFCENDVKQLVEKNLMDDFNKFEFEPDKTVTKGEFLQFIVRTFDLKRSKQICIFKDVCQNDRFYHAVQSAYEAGIVRETDGTDGEFRVNDEMTVEQAMIYFYRILNSKNIKTYVGIEDMNMYLGKGTRLNVLYPMTALYKNGILKTEDLFVSDSSKKVKRGELAVMLNRLTDITEY